jgi:lysophospholipase L1-like esterase
LFDCYGPVDELRRITFPSRSLAMGLQRPNFRARCADNGYRWNHQTDRWGLRQPQAIERAAVAIVGDSVVYGHGVEEDQTFASRLRRDLGVSVANVGRPAATPVHYLALLQNFALPLQPRLVIVVYFANDVDGIGWIRPPAALRRFIATGSAPEASVIARDQLLTEDDGARPGHTWRALEQHAMTWRTLRFYAWKLRASAGPSRNDVPKRAAAPAPQQVLAATYMRRAAELMASAAAVQGARLALAYVPTPIEERPHENDDVSAIVDGIAHALDLPYLDLTASLFHQGKPRPEVFLPRDGHPSPAGHRAIAAALAAFVHENKLL